MARPRKSLIRDRLVNILYYLNESHGYFLWKIYNSIYKNISSRVVYYHLDVGQDMKIFEIKKIKKSSGDYSWGNSSKNIIYKLSENADPNPERGLKEEIKKAKKDLKN